MKDKLIEQIIQRQAIEVRENERKTMENRRLEKERR